jgi:hypothetical protein
LRRKIVLALAAAAMLSLSPYAAPDARAQQSQIRVELDQAVVDKWLVFMTGIYEILKSGTVPQTEEALRRHIERFCAEAGFDSLDRCGEIMGYVAMIVATWDPLERSFRDPLPRMRNTLARLEADTNPTRESERTIAQLRDVLARLPERLPREHLQLINANRNRILPVIGAPARE